jgi:tRNA-2-methylthio-N6-dimethylallyladenosine synthase
MEDQIPEAVKRERLRLLNELQERKSRENNERYLGKTGEVHVEDCDKRGDPVCYGKFSNFKMVYFPGPPELVGRYVNVRVKSVRKNSLLGVMEDTKSD